MRAPTSLGMVASLRQRWRHRRARHLMFRWWHRRTPGEQLGTFIKILDESPALRKEFRRALRIRGMEAKH